MKKIILFSLLLFLFIPNIQASTSSAHSYILMDNKTGRVLDGKNINEKMLIASITKIMTSIVAIESGKLDEEITVDETILKSYGSGVYIEVGEKIKLRDLLYGLMLRSGNDAALMIAKFVSGDVDKFVEEMNIKANKIGMNNTNFVNPSGLDNSDSGNLSTSYDMAILTRYAMKNDEYKKIVSTKEYKVTTNKKKYIWKNKNKLLKYDYITGGKTGFTEKARRTLVSTASNNEIDLIVVTLKDQDDWNTHKSLYKKAFSEYKNYKFIDKNNFSIKKDKYYKGTLYIKKDIILPVKQTDLTNLNSKIKLEKKEKYKTGDRVGSYNIYLGKELIWTEYIYIKKKGSKKKNLIDKMSKL